MATLESTLLTVEQFFAIGAELGPTELVEGRIVAMNVPGHRHGRICRRLASALDRYLETHDLGDFTTNDSGIVTRRNPDSVRGADIAYYSYERLPRDHEPVAYPNVPPDILWEVLSPSDRWTDVLGKVHEYLEVGVRVVCVLDPEHACLISYYPDRPEVRCDAGDAWSEADILPGFRMPLDAIFGRKTA